MFANKIIAEKEIKLREFNFKLLQDILPYNNNLNRLLKSNSDKCDVGGERKTIEHLLYTCNHGKSI